MEVIPAVDIMKGKVVRLLKGDPKFAKSYEQLGDPVTLAKRWETEGARIIHVVDLDAALELGSNIDIVMKVINSVRVPIQVGGGIRSLDMARRMLNMGAARIILGSLAFEEPFTVKALFDKFGEDRIIIALDNINGVVMVHGWKTPAEITVDAAAAKFLKSGINLFLVTSIARDGAMAGPDFETLAKICRLGVKVIAAGGIRSLVDLMALKRLGVYGVIVGKALYEGLFTLSEALRTVEEK
ncbi:MAG: 1-(5-phosphoribosyl)-5-[(5-phosphoribosylamino)methylideneamino]imidazole-4-carboxamide isomerase [Candidatus Bathyarchaeia archaeon]